MVELMIDPGHGGRDPGGGTNQYWKEKDFVLDISLYQYNRFKELGVPVALTRSKDTYLSPALRTSIVKGSGATYCISNHINAGGGDGAETIHSIHNNGTLAKRILDAIQDAGQKVRRAFSRRLSNVSNKDYYFMHRQTGRVQTIIVEYGFADTSADVKRLRENWKDYAEAVVKAYCEHTKRTYVAPGGKTESKKETPKKTTTKKATSTKATLPTGIIKRGDRGEKVRQMQEAFASVHFYPDKGAKNNGCDGIFGAKTEDCVRRFQSVYLPHEVDGIYGKNTRRELNRVISEKGK